MCSLLHIDLKKTTCGWNIISQLFCVFSSVYTNNHELNARHSVFTHNLSWLFTLGQRGTVTVVLKHSDWFCDVLLILCNCDVTWQYYPLAQTWDQVTNLRECAWTHKITNKSSTRSSATVYKCNRVKAKIFLKKSIHVSVKVCVWVLDLQIGFF